MKVFKYQRKCHKCKQTFSTTDEYNWYCPDCTWRMKAIKNKKKFI